LSQLIKDNPRGLPDRCYWWKIENCFLWANTLRLVYLNL